MSSFRFKQFEVFQDRSAMKVGTDGVLLGAWVRSAFNVKNILDIGTGTGLIALMMAQKFQDAQIEAIDIAQESVAEADHNFKSSAWTNRLFAKHVSLQDFKLQTSNIYDVITCNPPYFNKGWKVEDQNRKLARDAAHLPAELLIEVAQLLLRDTGCLNVILPATEGEQFLKLAEDSGLFCTRSTKVFSKEGQPVKRYLLEISKINKVTQHDELIIEHAGINQFTQAYSSLTRDFYLHF